MKKLSLLVLLVIPVQLANLENKPNNSIVEYNIGALTRKIRDAYAMDGTNTDKLKALANVYSAWSEAICDEEGTGKLSKWDDLFSAIDRTLTSTGFTKYDLINTRRAFTDRLKQRLVTSSKNIDRSEAASALAEAGDVAKEVYGGR